MAQAEAELSGPDLREGVQVAALPDGGMLLGHADGEPVLLARRGDEVFAVGAVCTHYSGPLHEGLVVGDTVRCPWHHACFSLRTGEALRPPGLNPVACWTVERRGDLVRVTGKASAAGPAGAGGAGAGIGSIVIVGAGAAGAVAAETLRGEGYGGRITLIGADPAGPVDRPNLSKDYLAGTAPEEWIPLRPREFYAQHGIDLVLGTPAVDLDPAARRVVLADGRGFGYDRLLLATGADPVRLAIPGAELPQVHYLRTLADSRAIIRRAERSRRAVVLGASFVGLEVAASLRARGLEVHVAAPERLPLERVMGQELGAFIRRLHEERGVVFHLGTKPAAVTPDAVRLENGETLPADFVVAGIGVRPAVALAERAGLALDRGILVNRYLETSRPGIFAAGDLARWPDPHSDRSIRVEHWVVAERQGRTAARNMLGVGEPFEAVPFFWSQHYDVTIAYVGHAERWDRVEVHGRPEDKDCAVAFRTDDRVLAVATIFRDRVSLAAEAAMERRDPVALERVLAG